jgi:hypothetical protein
MPRRLALVAAVFAFLAFTTAGETGSGAATGFPRVVPTPTTAPGPTNTAPDPSTVPSVPTAVGIADGLDRPTHVTAPEGDDRIFVAERSGAIRIVRDGGPLPDPFLDLTTVVSSSKGERGLAGLAFHPDYEENRRFFVSFTDLEGDLRVLEYRTDTDDPDRADPESGVLVLEVPQPDQFHNGGGLEFGPDGELFIGLGDGAFSKEPNPRAQDLSVLHGKILRIDVDHERPYTIPGGNPFIEEGRAEIWAYGMRNPWRFWIDPVERLLVVGDVGQFNWEEVTVLSLDDGAGENLGWPVIEGFRCYRNDLCDADGMKLPRVVYPHPDGCAVIGGPVYRGRELPDLWGWALYADFCQGWVKAFDLGNASPVIIDVVDGLGAIQSLGVDGHGEVLIASAEGTIYRLEAVPVGP